MSIKNLSGGNEIKPLDDVIEKNNSIVPHSLFIQSVIEELTAIVQLDASADEFCLAVRSDPHNRFLSASLSDVQNRVVREEVKERIAEDLLKNGTESQFYQKPH